jgi:hypothetical protein
MITGKVATLSADHLFTMRDRKEARVLTEERALAFHHTVAQLLFMLMRARHNIQTAVVFLTTRVKRPDEDDWGKLKRVLKSLNGTKYLKLKLRVDDLGLLKWFVDGLHSVHWDCQGHIEAMLIFGKGGSKKLLEKGEIEQKKFNGDTASNR